MRHQRVHRGGALGPCGRVQELTITADGGGMNWRGRPLVSHEVIVQLMASTKTRSGLKVRAEIDNNAYPKGMTVSDDDFSTIKIDADAFHA